MYVYVKELQGPPLNESLAPSVRFRYKSSGIHAIYVCAVALTTSPFVGGPCSIPWRAWQSDSV
jgi:hypothetical protein